MRAQGGSPIPSIPGFWCARTPLLPPHPFIPWDLLPRPLGSLGLVLGGFGQHRTRAQHTETGPAFISREPLVLILTGAGFEPLFPLSPPIPLFKSAS